MSRLAELQARIDGVRDNLKSDFSKDRNILFEKIKANITNLQSRRLGEVRAIINDSYRQNIYCRDHCGSVFSDGCSLWSDLDKSCEYEAIFSSVLELLTDDNFIQFKLAKERIEICNKAKIIHSQFLSGEIKGSMV
jgi:hypothetical protein